MKLIPLFETSNQPKLSVILPKGFNPKPLTDTELKQLEKIIGDLIGNKDYSMWTEYGVGMFSMNYPEEKAAIKTLPKLLPKGITYEIIGGSTFVFSGSGEFEEKKKPEIGENDYGITKKDINNIENLNFHDLSELFDGKKHNLTLEELKNKMVENDVTINNKQLASLLKIINAGLVKWKDDANHEGNYTGLYQTKNKSWPWRIDTSIDHQPYSILMKVPIDFDTSY